MAIPAPGAEGDTLEGVVPTGGGRGEENDVTARSRKTFEQLVTLPDLAIPLVESALLLACEEYPQLVLTPYLEFLDRVAARTHEVLPSQRNPEGMIRAINAVLFNEFGFSGSTADYYDARSSFLNEVIDRRQGIPIALSAIYIAVADRLEFPIEGVGVPGHFIVRHRSRDLEVFVDPFNRGQLLTSAEVVELAERTDQGTEPRSWLKRSTNRQILLRMLNNLRMIYLRAHAFDKAVSMTDLMLITEPASTDLYRQRGILRLQLGQLEGAARDLRCYLESRSGEHTAETLDSASRLRRIQAMLN